MHRRRNTSVHPCPNQGSFGNNRLWGPTIPTALLYGPNADASVGLLKFKKNDRSYIRHSEGLQ